MKKSARTNFSVRFSERERKLLAQLQELFGLDSEAQTLRKIVRDTATELGVK